MTRVRLRMFEAGIRINDPRNGVWLHPAVADNWATPDCPTHNPVHGYNYETWVVSTLKLTLTDFMFEQGLKGLKGDLKKGSYPDKILEPKDACWNGQ